MAEPLLRTHATPPNPRPVCEQKKKRKKEENERTEERNTCKGEKKEERMSGCLLWFFVLVFVKNKKKYKAPATHGSSILSQSTAVKGGGRSAA